MLISSIFEVQYCISSNVCVCFRVKDSYNIISLSSILCFWLYYDKLVTTSLLKINLWRNDKASILQETRVQLVSGRDMFRHRGPQV